MGIVGAGESRGDRVSSITRASESVERAIPGTMGSRAKKYACRRLCCEGKRARLSCCGLCLALAIVASLNTVRGSTAHVTMTV